MMVGGQWSTMQTVQQPASPMPCISLAEGELGAKGHPVTGLLQQRN